MEIQLNTSYFLGLCDAFAKHEEDKRVKRFTGCNLNKVILISVIRQQQFPDHASQDNRNIVNILGIIHTEIYHLSHKLTHISINCVAP